MTVHNNKNTRQTRRSNTLKSNGSGHGLFLGVIIGLIIGVSAAVGVAMYLSNSKTPFSNLKKISARDTEQSTPKPHSHETLAPSTKLIDASQQTNQQLPSLKAMNDHANEVDAQASAAKQETTTNKNDTPEFDFYKILPNKSNNVSKTENPNKPPSSTSSTPNIPLHGKYLQVGAFKNEGDAENTKARLALLGIDAKIQTVITPNNNLIHRIKVGPYSHSEDLDSVRKQLIQNGFSVTAN